MALLIFSIGPFWTVCLFTMTMHISGANFKTETLKVLMKKFPAPKLEEIIYNRDSSLKIALKLFTIICFLIK